MFDQNKKFKFNPDLSSVLTGHISRYSLVRATAKRAREISEEAEENDIILVEKPVSIAMDELINHKYEIEEPDEIKNL
ncbi:MAG: DNA-directed RNA polymerase subunit omega [Ruminococcus sp.]|nr:DNA-directed RNA polymerase subunit omega [Candidatus Copronaster equi]